MTSAKIPLFNVPYLGSHNNTSEYPPSGVDNGFNFFKACAVPLELEIRSFLNRRFIVSLFTFAVKTQRDC